MIKITNKMNKQEKALCCKAESFFLGKEVKRGEKKK